MSELRGKLDNFLLIFLRRLKYPGDKEVIFYCKILQAVLINQNCSFDQRFVITFSAKFIST